MFMGETFRRRTALILAVMLVMILVVGGFGRSFSTEATWSDDHDGKASFRAGSVGTIAQFKCSTNNTWLPLVRNEVVFTWDEVPVSDGQKIDYYVTWDDGTLGGDRGSRKLSTPGFTYTPKFLDAFVRVEFTIHAELQGTEWRTPSAVGSASGLARSTFSCNSFS